LENSPGIQVEIDFECKKNYFITTFIFNHTGEKIMISKDPINHDRVRKISGSFSWIDHRLLSNGFLALMSRYEILLYFFLILVGDKNGISFYSYDKICNLLKIDLEDYIQARDLLIKRSLIAYDNSRFQVLELPTKHYHVNVSQRMNSVHSLKEIFNNLIQ
jgi:hypothetical protein